MKRRILIIAISAVLLLFFAVPIGFILYGAGAAIGGLFFLGILIILQLPVFLLLRSWGPRSSADCADD